MDDPRWQRAMERLGLVVSHGINWAEIPHPDDPATFLRVVEALWEQRIYPRPNFNELWLVKLEERKEVWLTGFLLVDGIAHALYEAVMEAFGGEDAEQK